MAGRRVKMAKREEDPAVLAEIARLKQAIEELQIMAGIYPGLTDEVDKLIDIRNFLVWHGRWPTEVEKQRLEGGLTSLIEVWSTSSR